MKKQENIFQMINFLFFKVFKWKISVKKLMESGLNALERREVKTILETIVNGQGGNNNTIIGASIKFS